MMLDSTRYHQLKDDMALLAEGGDVSIRVL
jgi:hypothetical protein